jgi:hypothetical protein
LRAAAKQSSSSVSDVDCFVALLLAMTNQHRAPPGKCR